MYIIGHYNPAIKVTNVVCINFIREGRGLQFNVDSKRQIFAKFLRGRFIYSQNIYQIFAERKSPKKYIFFFKCISF